LLASLPRLHVERSERLTSIPGSPPSLVRLSDGCPFAPRCPYVIDRCRTERPDLVSVSGAPEHRSACFRAEELPTLQSEANDE
jgi:oligopeptide/dipeptide ABC transporter ATP-binding protein